MWGWHGYFSAALPVYEAVLPFVTNPSERIQIVANIGRSSAAAGNAERFYDAWDQVNLYADKAAEWRATALLSLAHGAATLGFRRQANQLAGDALGIARSMGLVANVQQANRFLEEFHAGRGKDVNRATPPELESIGGELIRRLSRRRSLRESASPART